jgi:hypothetical protein
MGFRECESMKNPSIQPTVRRQMKFCRRLVVEKNEEARIQVRIYSRLPARVQARIG